MLDKFFTQKNRKVEKWINELGFRTCPEFTIGNYICDIWIPELNWVIEIEGIKKLKKKRIKRDDYLNSLGVSMIFHISFQITKKQFIEIFEGALGGQVIEEGN